jgi:hypothetical protein
VRLVANLLTAVAISVFLLGWLGWIWTSEPRHVATGAVAGIVLVLFAGALTVESKRREAPRE